MLADHTFAEEREESRFIWENFYDGDEEINEYDLTLFIRRNVPGFREPLYQKFQETHYQRSYDLDTVCRALAEAGLEFVAAYDAGTREPVRADSERIYVIARERGKTVQEAQTNIETN